METLGPWARSKFDTLLLLALFGYLLYRGAQESHEAFGALLLALTGGTRIQNAPNAPLPNGPKEN